MDWVFFSKDISFNCNGVYKQILIKRYRALSKLYAYTVAVVRLYLSKKSHPLPNSVLIRRPEVN